LQSRKRRPSADLQEDEDDLDYEDGPEDPVDPYHRKEDTVMDEPAFPTRPFVRTSSDADQVGTISRNLSSMNLVGESVPVAGRRRLHQRKDRSAIVIQSESEADSSRREDKDGDIEDEMEDVPDGNQQQDKEGIEDIEVSRKKKRKQRQHVLPHSFYNKHDLSEDFETLKAMRNKDKGISRSTEKTAGVEEEEEEEEEEEQAQLPHHAKRRIVPTDQDDNGILLDFMARLGMDQSQSDSDPERSNFDSDSSSGSLDHTRSPSLQPNGSNWFRRDGFDHGYVFSDDEVILETEFRARSARNAARKSRSAQNATRKSSSCKKVFDCDC